ncbi:MAG: M1 family metallopeptidase [Ginsengibacter sp.]
MKFFSIIIVFSSCFFGGHAFSQQLFHSTGIKNSYANNIRSLTGKPGANYWQNEGDYDIAVDFDPATALLTGVESILYFNNSPDTLKRIIIRLYPDLYKKGVARLSNISEKDLNDGVQIDSFKIAGETIVDFDNEKKAYHSGTNLIIKPIQIIPPHSKVQLFVKWHYTVNTGSQVRTGRVDSGSYFIAYFFPRVSVYDDIDGWDDWSYNGTQEFYNDFGNFKVQITVPKNFSVWATGINTNAADNLNKSLLEKIERAKKSDEIIHIIDSTDYLANRVFQNSPSGIWAFTADSLTDFAFATSDHYLWDASSILVDSSNGRRTVAEAVFNKDHKDYFDVANQAHQSVFYMSHYYPKYPFPFSHVTVFDGTDQMEYPMMVNDNPTETHTDAVQLTSHEIFHSYFPFYMGINETQYAWMDEGWATIGESVISPLIGEPEKEGIFSKTRYEQIAGTTKDLPLITNTKLYSDAAYYSNSYGKGGLCYYVLQDMLSDNLFFKCLHKYINDWHGKHPTPYDFFYSFNNTSGKDLNWFWQTWFFELGYPDLAIKKIEKSGAGSRITIENKGELPLPVYVTITSSQAKESVFRFNAETWKTGKKEMSFETKIPFAEIAKVVLGNQFIPEKYEQDNTWLKK